MTTPAPPLLMTVDQVADALQIHRTTVYDLIKSGALDSLTIGTRRRIPTASIEKYIEEHRA